MLARIFFIVLLVVSFVACASAPPSVTENVTYIEATKVPPPERKPVVVEVSKPLPLPGQLKRLPGKESADADVLKPWQVIEQANKGASHNPSKYGYYNSIMQYDFTPGALYQLYCAPLKLTDIQLQPGETIIGKPACGDTVRWIMGRGKSKTDGIDQQHLYIKPTRPGLDTTLTINTNRRTYHIELHSYKETYMAAISWRYPHDEIAMIQDEAAFEDRQNSIVTSTLVGLDKLNFGYQIKVHQGKKPRWLPVKCFDDGRKTFVQFPKDMLDREAPVLFVLSEDNNQTHLVNYRVKNEFYIIDRLIDRAELRLGQSEDKQTIVRITKVSDRLAKR